MLTRYKKTLKKRSWTTPEAFQFCEKLARDHYENFPVASMLTPREKRPHVYALYAFARIADDFADEPGLSTAERIDSLVDWEEQLLEAYRGQAHHPVFIALSETVKRFEIPVDLFQALLMAFRSDVTTNRHETFSDLLDYCSNSANPVGRLVLLLHNYRSESMMDLSDSICTALQLTNFWQDVSVDLLKDRVYIPLEDLREFGYSEDELFGRKYTQAFKDLMCFEVDRTRDLFRDGYSLLSEVEKDLRLELRLTWNGGMRILSKIERSDYQVLTHRPALSLFDKASLLVSSLKG
jgi:squalene synthase HpnC